MQGRFTAAIAAAAMLSVFTGTGWAGCYRSGNPQPARSHGQVQDWPRSLSKRDCRADGFAERSTNRCDISNGPMVAAVGLIKALGGGWSISDIPSPKEVTSKIAKTTAGDAIQ